MVDLPPLRLRTGDVPMLVKHFWQRFSKGEEAPDAVVRDLCARSWPGNVRELRNAVERAYVLRGSEFASAPAAHKPPPDAVNGNAFEDLLLLPIEEAKEVLEGRFFRVYLDHALARAGGSVSGAARLVGTNRRYIQRLMRRHGISAGDDDE